ncbi:bacteriohemerythrin [Desulfovibrio sp. TomC]|uniref:bacteriohemerythrin n=1 Tax=Desulfovibrio sp. TomC TaxID=1562888 RepID=UPI0009E233AF|nr:bacteriohemerythrin [Desulfovibrio sp. TomC]
MHSLAWNESLSLGIEEIDNEHRKLIDLSNILISSVKTNDRDIIKKCFHELREYTVTHFSHEEKYMDTIRFPDIEKHRTEHLELKLSVKHYQDSIYHQTEIDPAEVCNFIKHWLIDHVIYSDMNIKIFVNKNANKPPE